jgi:hypothetical protein
MPRTPSCLCVTCKRCKHRDYMRDWYQRKSPAERRALVLRRDPEVVRENDRKRYQRDKTKRNLLVRAAVSRNPAHQRARNAVNNAVRDGRLVRGPCATCGLLRDARGRATHGHHAEGYERPLVVVWLCQEHHTAAHVEGRHEAVSRSLPDGGAPASGVAA